MSGSYAKAELFKFASVDTVPSGVFQIRSRINVNICLGVKPDDEEAQDIADGIPQKTSTPGSPLIVQMCNVDVMSQFWSFNDMGRLVNAAVLNSLIQVELDDAGLPKVDGALTLGSCTEGARSQPVALMTVAEECDTLKSTFRYNEGSGDGLLLPKDKTNLVVSPAGGTARAQPSWIRNEFDCC